MPDGASLLVLARGARGAFELLTRPHSIFDDPNRSGFIFRDPGAPETTWLYLDGGYGYEWERSPYSGCVYDRGPNGSPAALMEQVAASVWAQTSGNDGKWVWP